MISVPCAFKLVNINCEVLCSTFGVKKLGGGEIIVVVRNAFMDVKSFRTPGISSMLCSIHNLPSICCCNRRIIGFSLNVCLLICVSGHFC